MKIIACINRTRRKIEYVYINMYVCQITQQQQKENTKI